jgi:hypothetical protein
MKYRRYDFYRAQRRTLLRDAIWGALALVFTFSVWLAVAYVLWSASCDAP